MIKHSQMNQAGNTARKVSAPAIAGLVVAALMVTIPLARTVSADDYNGANGDGANPYAIGLWGDLPYSTVQAGALLNLIADMNSQHLAFTVHDGDLKNGSSACVMQVYSDALNYFNSLRSPAAFTPGDNDWTDCDRTGGDPLVQLDLERSLFFNTPFTLGQNRFRQEVQATPLCLGAGNKKVPCVENRRWTVGRVTYVTLNIQGSCNNLCPKVIGPQNEEYAARNAANIAWMQETFEEAAKNHSSAVMIISQADPGFDETAWDAPLRDPQTLIEDDGKPDGFHDFLVALRDEVIAFQRPVAYVHGDSHYFRVDKPFLNAAGERLENFTRLETFGDHEENGANDVNWLKVLVDPNSREVFAYQPQIVPANRTAVPAPDSPKGRGRN